MAGMHLGVIRRTDHLAQVPPVAVVAAPVLHGGDLLDPLYPELCRGVAGLVHSQRSCSQRRSLHRS